MIISEKHIKILRAEICPYCNSSTKRVDEKFIYGRYYKNKDVICCSKYPECDSFVGCHKDGTPLGRLANKELRILKTEAHMHFDNIWQHKYYSRSRLYQKLSFYLNIPEKYTHIEMFSKETCLKVIGWSKNLIKNIDVSQCDATEIDIY